MFSPAGLSEAGQMLFSDGPGIQSFGLVLSTTTFEHTALVERRIGVNVLVTLLRVCIL